MKINIEIDVTPAELRQFLGLPDVAGLQDDMIDYLRTRVAGGAENFDPADLLRESTSWGNRTLQRLLGAAAARFMGDEFDDPGADDDPSHKRDSRTGGTGKSGTNKPRGDSR